MDENRMPRRMKNRWLALAVLSVFAVAGCELVADFDRSKIDAGSFDASAGDTSMLDSPEPDVIMQDAQDETPNDASDGGPLDSPSDTFDAGQDAAALDAADG